MREERIEIRLQRGRIEELTADERRGMDVALAAAERAYAPYSGFHVGAAVELADGRLVPGSNQENAAYPSGLCAERTALFTAGAQYPDVAVRALYVVAMKDGVVQDKISQCGGCRQVISEVEHRYGQSVRIYLCGRTEYCCVESAEALLPLSFGSKDL